MINSILFHASARLPCRLINRDDGERYLERYYLGRAFDTTFYLHRFVRRDTGELLHNHPWVWGRSIVLRGGYVEHAVDDLSVHGCITIEKSVQFTSRVDGNYFHRIAHVRPGTWTLFFHGPRGRIKGRFKGWGFLKRVHSDKGGVVFLPVPTAANCNSWWLTAPMGRDADRRPLRGHS